MDPDHFGFLFDDDSVAEATHPTDPDQVDLPELLQDTTPEETTVADDLVDTARTPRQASQSSSLFSTFTNLLTPSARTDTNVRALEPDPTRVVPVIDTTPGVNPLPTTRADPLIPAPGVIMQTNQGQPNQPANQGAGGGQGGTGGGQGGNVLQGQPPAQAPPAAVYQHPDLGEFQFVANPNLNAQTGVTYPKHILANLSDDKKIEINNKFCLDAGNKFDFPSDDDAELSNTFSVQSSVDTMERLHTMFDMKAIFQCLTLDPAGDNVVGHRDLYTDYASITAADVAKSNEFWLTRTNDAWTHQHLYLTYLWFTNNCSTALWTKVNEEYRTYPKSQQGGPLFFILLMRHVTTDDRDTAFRLRQRLTSYKITDEPGEDIHKTTSLLDSGVKRLAALDKISLNPNSATYSSSWVKDMYKVLLNALQTSSVDTFNDIFRREQENFDTKHIKASSLAKHGLTPAPDTIIFLDDVLTLANATYLKLCKNGQWAKTSSKASAFSAGTLTCFNCGGNHRFPDCKKPRDDDRIKANRKKYQQSVKSNKSNKNNNKSGTGNNRNSNGNNNNNSHNSNNNSNNRRTSRSKKWEAPRKFEVDGRRFIDGHVYKYNESTKRWDKVTSSPSALPSVAPAASVAPATVAPPSVIQPQTVPAPPVSVVTTNDASIANQARALSTVLTDILTQTHTHST